MKSNAYGNFSVFIILVITISLLTCSFKPTPKKIVESYIQNSNSHQVESVMALYTDSITFEVLGLGINFKGKDALRGVSEYDSVLNTIMTLTEITMSGDTVFCSLSEHNNWVEAAEIPDAYYPKAIFVVQDNKIAHIYAEIADSSLENFERVLDHFVFWGNEKYPEKMKQMAPDGNFVYNATNGVTVVEMLREWKAEQKQAQPPVSATMPKRPDTTQR